MNEISCGLCMDLLPLVEDGVASPDSVEAVQRHLEQCPHCRENSHLPPVSEPNLERAYHRIRRKLELCWAMLLMFGLFWGLSLTAGPNVFYNLVLMPVLGALGYGVFRGKSLYLLPGLVFLTHLAVNLLGVSGEGLELYSVTVWSGIYSVLAMIGSLIAWLLHFALRDRGKKPAPSRRDKEERR